MAGQTHRDGGTPSVFSSQPEQIYVARGGPGPDGRALVVRELVRDWLLGRVYASRPYLAGLLADVCEDDGRGDWETTRRLRHAARLKDVLEVLR